MPNQNQWRPGQNYFPALIGLRAYKKFLFNVAQGEGFFIALGFLINLKLDVIHPRGILTSGILG